MEKIKQYVKDNYKKIGGVMALVLVCQLVVSSVVTKASVSTVFVENSRAYGQLKEAVYNEINEYVEEKGGYVTKENVTEITRRVNRVVNEDGEVLNTVYQSEALEKVVTENVERNTTDQKNLASTTAEDVVNLVKRIDEGNEQFAKLIKSYTDYQEEMTKKLALLQSRDLKLEELKADKTALEEQNELTKESLTAVRDKLDESLKEVNETITTVKENANEETSKSEGALKEEITTLREDNRKSLKSLEDSLNASSEEQTKALETVRKTIVEKYDASLNLLETNITSEIEGIKTTTKAFEDQMDETITGVNATILTNKTAFDDFVVVYEGYKESVNTTLSGKADKSELVPLSTEITSVGENVKTNKANIEKLLSDMTLVSNDLGTYKEYVEGIMATTNTDIGNVKSLAEKNAKDIAKLDSGMVDKIYPVGSVYLSMSGTNPATLFGGTWKKLSGNYLYASDTTHTVGSTGGSNSVTLNANQIPSLTVSGSTGKTSTVAKNASTGTGYAVGEMRVVQAYDSGEYGDVRSASNHVVGYTNNPYETLGNGSTSFPAASHAHDFTIPSLTVNSASVTAKYTNNSQKAVTISPTYISVNMWQRTA